MFVFRWAKNIFSTYSMSNNTSALDICKEMSRFWALAVNRRSIYKIYSPLKKPGSNPGFHFINFQILFPKNCLLLLLGIVLYINDNMRLFLQSVLYVNLAPQSYHLLQQESHLPGGL